MNKHDIAELLPSDVRTTRMYLTHLHRKGRIYIHKWEKEVVGRARRYPTEHWAWGKGEDAPKPPADTTAQIKARVWGRLKENIDAHDAHKKRRQINTMLANKQRTQSTAWVFGTSVGSSMDEQLNSSQTDAGSSPARRTKHLGAQS